MKKEIFIDKFRLNIEKERIRLGYSQAAWAEALGMSLSSYKRLLLDTKKIDLDLLSKLYNLTGLLMFEFFEESSPRLDLIRKLRNLSDEQIAFITAITNFELAYKDTDLLPVIRPTGNMEDGMIYDTCSIEHIELPENIYHRLRHKIQHGIRITSNHLHPAYIMGDILLISSAPPRDGDTGIFINKNEHRAYIRKFRQGNPCVLEPVSYFGENIYIDPSDPEAMDQWIKFGTVVSKIR